MLAANEAVGESFQRRNEPVLWRIHEAPDAVKLETFAALAQSYGLPFDLDEARTPKGLSAACWPGSRGTRRRSPCPSSCCAR